MKIYGILIESMRICVFSFFLRIIFLYCYKCFLFFFSFFLIYE